MERNHTNAASIWQSLGSKLPFMQMSCDAGSNSLSASLCKTVSNKIEVGNIIMPNSCLVHDGQTLTSENWVNITTQKQSGSLLFRKWRARDKAQKAHLHSPLTQRWLNLKRWKTESSWLSSKCSFLNECEWKGNLTKDYESMCYWNSHRWN